ncbi:phosphoserine phosphatase [Methylopila capsulata]|uniref:Phosphoserine phosphatase n=1 Tax=Methylopila capsulata TaxID=61654 RepID=A0A9W6IVT7_9HYPH|nr:phosphoserine phosphatase SerB [Methylopila capsulata]MBM7853331.1 phosphoserine phosphatase [Methylopila capsulata]GLK57453.1 phosphoserine phosphatase SerB [Methylopila capsulata]
MSALAAVLIANPNEPAVDAALVMKAAQVVQGAEVRMLDGGIAAEFIVEGESDRRALRRRLLGAIDRAPVDVAVVPVEARRKRLLIADMDSTMIEQECLDELAAGLGLKDRVAAITERAMRGEIEFEPALRERVALLKGLPAADTIAEVLENRITLTPGGLALVATMHANGAYAALVSGGFTAFTEVVAAKLGFDENRANVLEIEADLLAGRVVEPILGRDAKLAALNELMKAKALDRAETIAVGDGANDLAMLGGAGLGVAYRAKPAVAEAAHVRIDHGDLTALLYLQGYAEHEIVAD